MTADDMKNVLWVLVSVLLASCARPSHGAPASEPVPMYGWLAGECLALPRHDLPVPHDFVLVDFTHGRQRIHGVVVRRAVDKDHCPALLPDRRDVNKADGNVFYVVKLDAPSELGIGIVGKAPVEQLAFGHCTTSEGVRFTVARGGQRVWNGYYYLGYDVEPSCTDPDE